MTTSTRVLPVRPNDRPSTGRLIVVGVADATRDAAALRWAVSEARAGTDVVHVVHAFVPAATAPGGVPGGDPHFLAARRIAQEAIERAARPGVQVEGSAVSGLSRDVLREFTGLADLMVVGEISEELADIARCPVVGVPRAQRPVTDGWPVSLVVAPHGLTGAASRFAVAWAAGHHSTLQVCRGWASDRDGPRPSASWMARRQEEFDVQLADVESTYPDVPVVTRTEFATDWLLHAATTSSLLVVPAADGAWTARALDAAHGRRCPLAVIPEPLTEH